MRTGWLARRELTLLGTVAGHDYVRRDLPEIADAIVTGLPA
jgi:hypothetical protein